MRRKAIGPIHQGVKVVRQLRLAHGHAAFDDLGRSNRDGDPSPFVQEGMPAASVSRSRFDHHRGGADNALAVPCRRHYRRVAVVMPAPRGENADRGMHARTYSGEVSTRAENYRMSLGL